MEAEETEWSIEEAPYPLPLAGIKEIDFKYNGTMGYDF